MQETTEDVLSLPLLLSLHHFLVLFDFYVYFVQFGSVGICYFCFGADVLAAQVAVRLTTVTIK